MGNISLQFALLERKPLWGKFKGKTMLQAVPTGRKRISHRNFCESVARGTTFCSAEIEAVLRLVAEVAKREVECGNSVDLGDLGILTPSFRSLLVEKGVEEFNPLTHILSPIVRLSPSKKYFQLKNVHFERVEAKSKKL